MMQAISPKNGESGSRLACIAALLLALGVAAGAFGAHALREVVSERRLEVWQTAVLYLLVHGVALLSIGLFIRATEQSGVVVQRARLFALAIGCLLAGIVIFSGSLFMLVLLDEGWLGAVTPLGGSLLIIGWVLLALALAGPLKR